MFGRTLAAPLLIINGFKNQSGTVDPKAPNQNHYNVAHLMIQNMFPPLDLAKVKGIFTL
jgi:hypothetical protein